jgi:hypothetical protein
VGSLRVILSGLSFSYLLAQNDKLPIYGSPIALHPLAGLRL